MSLSVRSAGVLAILCTKGVVKYQGDGDEGFMWPPFRGEEVIAVRVNRIELRRVFGDDRVIVQRITEAINEMVGDGCYVLTSWGKVLSSRDQHRLNLVGEGTVYVCKGHDSK